MASLVYDGKTIYLANGNNIVTWQPWKHCCAGDIETLPMELQKGLIDNFYFQTP
jgi:hypothetical protein